MGVVMMEELTADDEALEITVSRDANGVRIDYEDKDRANELGASLVSHELGEWIDCRHVSDGQHVATVVVDETGALQRFEIDADLVVSGFDAADVVTLMTAEQIGDLAFPFRAAESRTELVDADELTTSDEDAITSEDELVDAMIDTADDAEDLPSPSEDPDLRYAHPGKTYDVLDGGDTQITITALYPDGPCGGVVILKGDQAILRSEHERDVAGVSAEAVREYEADLDGLNEAVYTVNGLRRSLSELEIGSSDHFSYEDLYYEALDAVEAENVGSGDENDDDCEFDTGDTVTRSGGVFTGTLEYTVVGITPESGHDRDHDGARVELADGHVVPADHLEAADDETDADREICTDGGRVGRVNCRCGGELEHSHGEKWKCPDCGRFHDADALDRLADRQRVMADGGLNDNSVDADPHDHVTLHFEDGREIDAELSCSRELAGDAGAGTYVRPTGDEAPGYEWRIRPSGRVEIRDEDDRLVDDMEFVERVTTPETDDVDDAETATADETDETGARSPWCTMPDDCPGYSDDDGLACFSCFCEVESEAEAEMHGLDASDRIDHDDADGADREVVTDGGTDRPLVVDLYCGHGGVGLALDELDVDYIGVDIEDRSDTYPGKFVRADASRPPLDVDADLVWASPPCTAYSSLSPTHYGSREAALEECPTIPELRVHEIADELGSEYVIENVPGASREGHIQRTVRVNGLAFGKPYDLERHFETTFPVPDAVVEGEPTVKVQTREGQDQSAQSLAEAKGVPQSWGKQGVRSAIPREYVNWLLTHCPTVEAPRPDRKQKTLPEVTDGGRPIREGAPATFEIEALDDDRHRFSGRIVEIHDDSRVTLENGRGSTVTAPLRNVTVHHE